MADIHLNTTGSNTAPYDTWAKAATTLATAVGGMAAGDNLLIDKAFTTSAAGVSVAFPGTPASPNRIYSGTPAAGSGLSDVSAGAKVVSSTTSFSVNGSVHGFLLEFEGTSASGTTLNMGIQGGNVQVWEDCYFNRPGTSNSGAVQFGASGSNLQSQVTLIRPSFRFGATGQNVRPHGLVDMFDVKFVSGTNPTIIFAPATGGRGNTFRVFGMDCANLGTTFAICNMGGDQQGSCQFSDIELPASWSGTFSSGTVRPNNCHDFFCADSADTQYRFWMTRYEGNIHEDAAVYLSGSTTDGGSISDVFETSANVAFPGALKGRWYVVDVSSGLGSSKTATIQCAMDGASTIPTDAEVWMELEFFGTSGVPLGKYTTDRCTPFAFLTSAATTHNSSSESWTGLGGTNCKFKLECTFTPEEAGYIRARVCTAMASNSQLHVDPNITVT